MEKTNWYAVFTAFRTEKRVKERLEQAGIENYLPVREVEFERDGQVRRLEIPVISGCIFVHVPEMSSIRVINFGCDRVVEERTGADRDFGQAVG